MPGVLVDDQNYSLDALSQAFLLDSLASPVSSCCSPLSLTFQASSHSQSPANLPQTGLMRTSSQTTPDAEAQAYSQISPLLDQHRQVSSPCVGGLSRFYRTGPIEGIGTEEFLGTRPLAADDPYGTNCDGVLAQKSGELALGGVSVTGRSIAGGLFARNEHDDPEAGLPFTSGNSLWSGQATGGGLLVGSPTLPDSFLALQKFLPSNLEDEEAWAVDVSSCDEFRMFEFKVRRCMRGRSHDWTECPFAHPGEKARRRDPRRFHYSGTACPDFRKGNCKRGDACEFAHGVFECWLHPARYRTQPCKDERNCKRRVCFFAHTPEQLRQLAPPQASNGGSPRSSLSSSPPLKSAFAQKLAQCAAVASYDGSPLRSCGIGAPFVDPSQMIDAGSPPPGFRDAVAADCSSFARLGSFGGSNSSSRSGASLLSSGYFGSSLHHSPASLSPPLSPSMSPPGSPVDWVNPLTKNFACLAAPIPGTPSNPVAQSCNMAQFASFGQPVHPFQSHAGVPAHRRHLDRLNPSLTLSIPGDQGRTYSALSSPTSACVEPSNQMVDLISRLKQVELSGTVLDSYWLQAQAAQAATTMAPKFSSGPSPLRRGSRSVPGTPTKPGWKSAEVDLWGLNEKEAEPALERVESGRYLRATIFENLVKGNEQGTKDDPDVGWVSELVKEELH